MLTINARAVEVLRRTPASLPAGVVLLLCLTGITGCTNWPVAQRAANDVAIETVDSSVVHVRDVEARLNGDRLVVSGYLERHVRQRGSITGALLIEALSTDGSVIESIDAAYHPRLEFNQQAHFSETLSVPPADVQGIRVTHVTPLARHWE